MLTKRAFVFVEKIAVCPVFTTGALVNAPPTESGIRVINNSVNDGIVFGQGNDFDFRRSRNGLVAVLWHSVLVFPLAGIA